MKLNDLIGKQFRIKVGGEYTACVWDKESLLNKIRSIIKNKLMDVEFFYNWTDNKGNYHNAIINSTIQPMMDNIDETLEKYFYFSDGKLECDFGYAENWIDNWFLTCDKVEKELLDEYIKYRKEYAHDDILDPNRKIVKDHPRVNMSKNENDEFNKWLGYSFDYICISFGMYLEKSTETKVTLNYLKHIYMLNK